MPHPRTLKHLLLAALLACAFSAPASAQKLGRKAFEDEEHGYQFRPPEDFEPVPPQPQEAALGTIVRLSGKALTIRKEDKVFSLSTEAVVLRFAERTVAGQAGEGETVSENRIRDDISAYLEANYRGLEKDKPFLDEEKKVNRLTARHRTWNAKTARESIPLLIDAWSFHLSDADLHLIYVVPEEHGKKWIKVFEQSAKTFMEIDRSAAGAGLKDGASYEELLAHHKADAQKIPGWTALPTPSKKFILKTSSDNRKFLDEVILRLEKSRELYEADFPPSADFDHVSIVRVCGSEEEFHRYGKTGAGTAGWFNPATIELVLYDAVSVDRNMTYAVMSHEAFHQYCHFLFEQSEAHRWFDEGHGDYYGGAEFKGNKAIITSTMPGGLNRREQIKEMVGSQTYAPIAEHINFDHGEWKDQGPDGTSCYSQSWSIIYMLRQGMLGKVPKKAWAPEYAAIIPSYVETLHAGFRQAFDEIRAEREQVAVQEGRELTGEELEVNRFDLPPGAKEKIWKAAMDASWGQIDLDQFEAHWVTFVQDCL
jgi:hypothetical protein